MRYLPNCPRNLTRGQAIRELRKIYNLTQKDIARVIGISSNLVSKWECGAGVFTGDPRRWYDIGVPDSHWNYLKKLYLVLCDMDVTRR